MMTDTYTPKTTRPYSTPKKQQDSSSGFCVWTNIRYDEHGEGSEASPANTQHATLLIAHQTWTKNNQISRARCQQSTLGSRPPPVGTSRHAISQQISSPEILGTRQKASCRYRSGTAVTSLFSLDGAPGRHGVDRYEQLTRERRALRYANLGLCEVSPIEDGSCLGIRADGSSGFAARRSRALMRTPPRATSGSSSSVFPCVLFRW